MRLLITKIHELPIRLEHLTALEDDLKECYDNKPYHEQVKSPEKYFDKKMPQVTEKFALSCPKFLDRIEVVKKGKKKYKTKELDDSEIEFQMIGSNVSSVIGQLDHVRKNQKKFLCINDNMDHSSKGKASKILSESRLNVLLKDKFLSFIKTLMLLRPYYMMSTRRFTPSHLNSNLSLNIGTASSIFKTIAAGRQKN